MAKYGDFRSVEGDDPKKWEMQCRALVMAGWVPISAGIAPATPPASILEQVFSPRYYFAAFWKAPDPSTLRE